MPQPDSLAGVDFTNNGPFRRSRRDFLTGAAGRRTAGDDYWIRVHRRAMACRFEITLASRDVGCVPIARTSLNEIDGVARERGTAARAYALDRVAVDMRRAGVAHALLSAGRRNVLAIGGRGFGWEVNVAVPQGALGIDRPIARLWMHDAAIATSGAAAPVLMADGEHDGYALGARMAPAPGVISASAVTASADAADALSTAFLIGGAVLAERYCAEHPGVIAIITRDDGAAPLIFGSRSAVRIER